VSLATFKIFAFLLQAHSRLSAVTAYCWGWVLSSECYVIKWLQIIPSGETVSFENMKNHAGRNQLGQRDRRVCPDGWSISSGLRGASSRRNVLYIFIQSLLALYFNYLIGRPVFSLIFLSIFKCSIPACVNIFYPENHHQNHLYSDLCLHKAYQS
jgi:hypothetical protein